MHNGLSLKSENHCTNLHTIHVPYKQDMSDSLIWYKRLTDSISTAPQISWSWMRYSRIIVKDEQHGSVSMWSWSVSRFNPKINPESQKQYSQGRHCKWKGMPYFEHARLFPVTRKLPVDNKRDAISLKEVLHLWYILCVLLTILCQGCHLLPSQLLEQL